MNKAARRLLIDYDASFIVTNENSRRIPLGRDEKKIYPLPNAVSNEANEIEYDSNNDSSSDEYEDDGDEPDKKNPISNSDFYNDGSSDVRTSNDRSSLRSDSGQSQSLFNDARPLIPRDRTSNRLLSEYLLYLIGCLSLLCLIIGIFVARRLRDQRRQSSRLGNYQKTTAFTGVDSCTPEEKALHALQTNGYENPTYKFFETQTLKC